ncbi:MAG TPA: FliG C-terminal domain-containing protein, partial [Desulfobacter sp.]|nr:FliG C-terminal domain-containing protein [Desulfobacter sp.]
RKLMFVFEDLGNVDDTAMREILKKVEGQQLTYALKTATEDTLFLRIENRHRRYERQDFCQFVSAGR